MLKFPDLLPRKIYARITRFPVGIYLLKVNNRNTRTRCEICSKLTIKTYFTLGSSVSIANFEHVIAGLFWLVFFVFLHIRETKMLEVLFFPFPKLIRKTQQKLPQ